MNQNKNKIYIGLGANLGHPQETFHAALELMKSRGINISALSGVWQSPAWPPGHAAPEYMNMVVEVNFEGSASEILSQLQSIETEMGRRRSYRNAPRILDLDILDFKGEIHDTKHLTLPHPRLHLREFVLFPLSQINSYWESPLTGVELWEYIARLPLGTINKLTYLGQLKT